MNWNVGDQAICIRPGSWCYGEVVTVQSALIKVLEVTTGQWVEGHEISVGESRRDGRTGLRWIVRPQDLRPLPGAKDQTPAPPAEVSA